MNPFHRPVKPSVQKERLKEPKIEVVIKSGPSPNTQKQGAGLILVPKTEFPTKKDRPSKPLPAPIESPQKSSTPLHPKSERSERSERSEYSSPKKHNKSPCHYTAGQCS